MSMVTADMFPSTADYEAAVVQQTGPVAPAAPSGQARNYNAAAAAVAPTSPEAQVANQYDWPEALFQASNPVKPTGEAAGNPAAAKPSTTGTASGDDIPEDLAEQAAEFMTRDEMNAFGADRVRDILRIVDRNITKDGKAALAREQAAQQRGETPPPAADDEADWPKLDDGYDEDAVAVVDKYKAMLRQARGAVKHYAQREQSRTLAELQEFSKGHPEVYGDKPFGQADPGTPEYAATLQFLAALREKNKWYASRNKDAPAGIYQRVHNELFGGLAGKAKKQGADETLQALRQRESQIISTPGSRSEPAGGGDGGRDAGIAILTQFGL